MAGQTTLKRGPPTTAQSAAQNNPKKDAEFPLVCSTYNALFFLKPYCKDYSQHTKYVLHTFNV